MDQSLPDSTPPQAPTPPARAAASPAPRKSRRRWWIVAGVLLAAAALLVALAPTIASTGPMRTLVVGQINGSLNGKLQIADWSLGWNSGTRVSGVKLFDGSGQLILDIGRVDTQLSLLEVLRGKLDAGEVTIDGLSFLARREADGQINFAKLAKSPSKSTSTNELPDLRGRLTLKNAHGTYEDLPNSRTVHFDSVAATVNIPDINGPIEHQLDIAARSGQGGSGTLSVKGSSDVIDNRQVRLDSARIHEQVAINSFDNAGLSPLIPASLLTTFSGVTSGALAIDIDQPAGGTIEGKIVSRDLVAAGPALQGERLESRELAVIIPKTSIALPSTPGAWEDWRLAIGGAGQAAEPISITLAQADEPARISLGGQFTPRQIMRLRENMAPAGEGNMALAANINFGELARRLPKTFAAMNDGLQIDSGKLAASVQAAYAGEDVTLQSRLSVAQVSIARTFSPAVRAAATQPVPERVPLLNNYDLTANVDLKARLGKQGVEATVSQLDIHDNQPEPIIAIRKADQPLAVSFMPGAAARPSGAIDLNIDLARANQLLRNFTAAPVELVAVEQNGAQLLAGRLKGTLRIDSAADGLLAAAGEFTVAGIRVKTDGQPIENETLALTLALKAGAGFETLEVAKITARSRLLDLDLTDTLIAISPAPGAAGLLPQVQRATLQARIAELGQAHDFLRSLQPPAATVTPTDGGPTQLRAGSATIQASLSRKDDWAILTAAISGKDVAYKTNGVFRQVGPVEIKLETRALADRSAPAAAPLAAHIKQLQAPAFSLVAAGSHVELAKPLVIENPAKLLASFGPAAGGAAPAITAELGGQLALGPFQEAIEGLTGRRQSDRYQGRFDFRQTISTGAQGIAAKGEARIHDLRLQPAGGRAMTEPEIGMVNDLVFQPAGPTLTIGTIAFDTPSSKAIAMRLSGAIADLSTTPALQNVVLEWQSEQAASLWTLLQPLLASPADPASAAEGPGNSLDGAKLSGKSGGRLELGGKYATDQPFYQAVKGLIGKAHLTLDKFDGFGLTIVGTNLGFDLRDGKLALSHPTALPNINGGEINLAGVTIDLGQLHPRLATPPNHPLARNISINPVLADSVIGRFVNPVFANAQQARGLLDVTVVNCSNLALDYLRNSPIAAESGRAELNLALRDVFLGVPQLASTVNQLFPNAFNNDGFEASINDARVVIERGQVTNQMTLTAGKQYAIGFSGGLGMQENRLIDFKVSLPASLIANINKSWAKYVPERGLVLPLAGSSDNFMSNFGEIIQPVVTQLATQALGDRVLPGLGGAATRPTSPEDAIGGLLGDLLGGKPQETDAEKQARRQQTREERARKAQEKAAATTQPVEPAKKKKKK